MRVMLAVLFALALTACATGGGSNFNEARVQELRPGMSEPEVIALLGAKPMAREFEIDGSYVAAWLYVRSNPFTLNSESKNAYLKFDRNRGFVRVVDFGKLVND